MSSCTTAQTDRMVHVVHAEQQLDLSVKHGSCISVYTVQYAPVDEGRMDVKHHFQSGSGGF